ncbi:LPS export ABC transporter permease LptF [Pacificimonas flava]|uniref:LPS export ABC transporter permease LptF n=2 Tax=Pacificimonas TaxID=1960290 RepID=A0A219B164_9SPHN|nr:MULTISPECIES: LPS export ABC transporter permease LptF [Pacificimonas]MBZ6378328.1 LPS export ABC transporter permease LptF [Pacificimonas aurantium]OWV32065.1 LPS export ABC transporter permease LptF [Pacificimonas flava]
MPLSRLDRYLFSLILLPLLATLIIAAMLLLLDKMLRLFDFVVNEGGPISVVWRLLGNSFPEYLGLGIPVGLLIGILLAFRKLALSSELDAMRAVGISYVRMLRVPYGYALALSGLTLIIVGFIQPVTRYAYDGLEFELRSGALGASIGVGEFVTVAEGTTLRVEESRDNGSDLRGIFLNSRDDRGRTATATASRGTFLSTDDPDIILLRLTEGTLVHDGPNQPEPRVLSFENYDLAIPLPEITVFRARGADGDRLELTLPELSQAAGERQDLTAYERRRIEANFHRRLVQVFVPFVIPLLAIALSVPPKRSSSAVGVFAALIILVVYNEVSESAERMGGAGDVPIALSQWGTFAAFSLMCIWFFYVLAFRPAGQPIGILEAAVARIAKPIRAAIRWVRMKLRQRRSAAAA